MDPEHAEPVAAAAVARRNLIGLAGIAGLAGTATAMMAGTTTNAAPDEEMPDTSDAPNQPTDSDVALLRRAMALELTAVDLYQAQLAQGTTGDLSNVFSVMAENHQAYAQAVAGVTGLSAGADDRDDALFDELVVGFNAGDFLANAHSLEQSAVATHTELMSQYESLDALALTAAILVVEARHATVLADAMGIDDLDTLFGNDGPAFSSTGGDA